MCPHVRDPATSVTTVLPSDVDFTGLITQLPALRQTVLNTHNCFETPLTAINVIPVFFFI